MYTVRGNFLENILRTGFHPYTESWTQRQRKCMLQLARIVEQDIGYIGTVLEDFDAIVAGKVQRKKQFS